MIHPLALVDVPIENIGAGSKVWQFASVLRGAKVGRGCTVAAYALIDAATVGDDCLISSGAQLHPGTKIGNKVFVGPGVIFCNDRWPRVGKDGFNGDALLSGSHVTIEVHDGASIGAGAVILPGVIIGKGAVVAAGTVVTHSVPQAAIWKRSGGWKPMSARRPERMPLAGEAQK